MGFSLHGENRLNVFYTEIIRFVLRCRGELFGDRPVEEGTVVSVCRDHMVAVLPGCAFNKVKKG